tara:strand:- start:562 stop:735 length:174 start_codon:yes stop_codon:yes gene_type:complete
MKRSIELIGWLLFLLCAVLFLISGLRNNDVWTIIASVLFGIGVILFLVGFKPKKEND